MHSRRFVFIICLFFTLFSHSMQAKEDDRPSLPVTQLLYLTPFSIALDTLQNQINYTFKNDGLLRRAMTHASFSEENNKALSILGASVIETSVALQYLTKDVDISAKDLNIRIAEVSKVEGSCTAGGTRLGLQKIVRVSHKTDATIPAVICGAFRAVFGAIAVDAASSDEAVRIFGNVRGGIGRAMAI